MIHTNNNNKYPQNQKSPYLVLYPFRDLLLLLVWINKEVSTLYNSALSYFYIYRGLPWWLSGKISDCQCRRCRFDPWVGKTPWGREWLLTPVFLPGKSNGQRSLASVHRIARVRHDLVATHHHTYIYAHKRTCIFYKCIL